GMESKKPVITLDIEFPAGEAIQAEGTAYYRLDKQMKDFLANCAAQHTIIGFEYIPDSWNFGVILQKNESNPIQN
ncbi:MAG: hypothetical protein ACREGC_00980, partial [Minisyncoccia bacterium]